MKRTLFMAIAASSLMLIGCGNKQGDQTQAATNEGETAVEDNQVLEREGELTPDSIEYSHELEVIGKACDSKTLNAGKAARLEQFATAFCEQYSNYMPNKYLKEHLKSPAGYDEETSIYRIENQAKNGYLSCFINGDLDWGTMCCYWNRNNGHKLVAFYMDENHESWEAEDKLLTFYDYDPATGIMTPEPNLAKIIDDAGSKFDVYWVTLPSEGKDIEVTCHNLETNHEHFTEVVYMFRWNGNDFKMEKVKETVVG